MTDAPTQSAAEQIKSTVEDNEVVLFMKGNRQFPQCGFSSRVVSILQYMKVDFKDVNVLEDDALRQGVKEFTQWPTIPQLYVKGEFVGGCDIITEMTLSGEIDQMFDDKKIAYDKDAVEQIRAQNG